MCKSPLTSITELKLTLLKLKSQAVNISERRKDKIVTEIDLKTSGVLPIY